MEIAILSLENFVSTSVEEVGPTYDAKMMEGYLHANKDVNASQDRIRKSLQRVHPYCYESRRFGVEKQINPGRYHAPHFGYNLHVDQNEKLEMYGVVFVAAIDGFSAFITSVAVIPKKNNITIYRDVYVKTTENCGLFERVIVDRGKKFFLRCLCSNI